MFVLCVLHSSAFGDHLKHTVKSCHCACMFLVGNLFVANSFISAMLYILWCCLTCCDTVALKILVHNIN